MKRNLSAAHSPGRKVMGKTFTEEYYKMLKEFEIDFDNRYLFKPSEIDYNVPNGT